MKKWEVSFVLIDDGVTDPDEKSPYYTKKELIDDVLLAPPTAGIRITKLKVKEVKE
ncbi:MAG: hypothetical protein MN733_28165 [Nitrososphaera sp.]|nr:hypothetical protein [Nitrososphaera sp.]